MAITSRVITWYTQPRAGRERAQMAGIDEEGRDYEQNTEDEEDGREKDRAAFKDWRATEGGDKGEGRERVRERERERAQ